MFIIKAVYLVWYMYRMYLFKLHLQSKKNPFSSQYVYPLLNSQMTRRDDQE